MFKTNKKERDSGIGMWSVRPERLSAAPGECCVVQSDDSGDPNYLPACCVEIFFHDKKQTNIGGSIVGNSYPWPRTKRPS